MTHEAMHAIKAAKGRKSWGYWATMRYLSKRGVSLGAYRLARQLEAVASY